MHLADQTKCITHTQGGPTLQCEIDWRQRQRQVNGERWKVRRMSDVRLIRLSKGCTPFWCQIPVAEPEPVPVPVPVHRYLTASQLVALKLHGSLNSLKWGHSMAGRGLSLFDCAVHFTVSWQCQFIRIVAYSQASTRTACCLLLGGAIKPPPSRSELVTTFWMPFR